MDYRPNIDGVLWFAKHVWPQVRARCPKATFYIVGRRPAPAIQRLAQVPGVIVTGAVPDVRPYLNRAAVVVAPLLIARGIQNKILEAMAACRPVVASPEAIVGLPAHPREHLIEAASIEEWGSAVCRLLKDPCLQRRFGRAARKYAENQHAWERCLSAYVDVLKTTQRRAADTATWREPGSWLAHIGATMQRTSG
ncbi:MAG: glycosyltransferase [Planctomycetes bacterium]|nr:glycosyltransferase [Planctomycetota bacterium]